MDALSSSLISSIQRVALRKGPKRDINVKETAQKLGINREKLTDLLAGKDVTLSLTELANMDKYLSKHMCPVLACANLIQNLASPGRIHFDIGVHPRAQDPDHRATTDISHWDVQAMNQIVNSVNRAGNSCHFELHTGFPGFAPTLPMKDREGSLVVIGSPRSCGSSFQALRDLFPEGAPPFRFFWPDTPTEDRFCTTTDDIDAKPYPKHAGRMGPTGILIGNTTFRESPVPGQRFTYAVIAVRLRQDGPGAILLLAGLTGPGSFAAAKAAFSESAILNYRLNQDAPAAWWAIEAKVNEDTAISVGDNRDPRDINIIAASR